jgi:outer membrane protein OmpA-like peptidoglycan-associated protein
MDVLRDVLTTIGYLKLNALDLLGPLAPIVTGAGQIIAAAIALFLLLAGRGFWAPRFPDLPDFAVRLAGAVAGIGVVALYLWGDSAAAYLLPLALVLVLAAFGLGVVYLRIRLTYCFRCAGDRTLYIRGLELNPYAKQVLDGKSNSTLPRQYQLAPGQTPPLDEEDYFCKAGKIPTMIWERRSHVRAQIRLFLSYAVFIVPLTLAIASASLALGRSEVEERETPQETRFDVPADILFDFGQYTLRPAAVISLRDLAERMKQRPVTTARIEGHTDSVGRASDNLTLSLRRAQEVRRWLTGDGGLSGVKFEVQGFGEEQPVESNTMPDGSDNPDGRAMNRRVVVVVDK